MKLEAIILDIDGTLLTSNHVISPKTKEILMKAQDQGIKVILASGRPTRGMLDIAKELELEKHHGLIVSYNGACVVDLQTQEYLYQQQLTIDESKRIFKHLEQFDVIPMLEEGEYICVNNAFDGVFDVHGTTRSIIEYEARVCNFLVKEITDLSTYVSQPLNKILVAGVPQYLQDNYKEMQAPFMGELSMMFTAPFYFEYTSRDVNKGKAISHIFEILNVNHENTISFGDGQNDESIIELAGIGVAMENAVNSLKQIADHITLSNDNDGIAEVLKEYIK